MWSYAFRRLLALVPTLLAISFIVFLMIHLVPGDPAQLILGERATPQALAELRQQLGLNLPLHVQYAHFLNDLVHGNLGRSLKTQELVAVELRNRFPATLELALASMFLAAVIGIAAGIFSAARRRTWIDYLAMFGALVGVSMPIFWLGLMLMLLFSVQLGWLPLSGRLTSGMGVEPITHLVVLDALLRGRPDAAWDAVQHLILPAIALGTIPMAVIARMTRSSVLEILNQDYVRTARAKGLAEWKVVMKHVLKNSFIPILTVLGLEFGSLLGGAIITETIFAWPGVGRYLVLSVEARDFRAVQAGVMMVAALFVIVNLVVDLLYSFFDPRIRYT